MAVLHLASCCSTRNDAWSKERAPAVSIESAETLAQLRAEFAPLIRAHNERVARLDLFESKGTVEIRYRDETGSHFEQADIELALAPSGRGSLKLSKLGSDLFWIGGDGSRTWVFDLREKPAAATVSEHSLQGAEDAAAEAICTGDMSVLTPESLRFVMGLATIPADPAETAFVAWADEDRGTQPSLRRDHALAWQRGRVRIIMAFDDGGLAEEIRLVDAAGKPLARSRLSEYEPARADDLSQSAWPKVATRVRMEAADTGSEVRLDLAEPAAQARRMKPRYFDLNALLQHFSPESVTYLAPRLDTSSTRESPSSAEPAQPRGSP